MGIAPIGDEVSLSVPQTVTAVTADGIPFTNPQKLAPGSDFYVTFHYGDIPAGCIDTTKQYPLPSIPAKITLASESAEQSIIGDDGLTLGTLRYSETTGLTFQFDPRFGATLEESDGVGGFYLKMLFKVSADNDHIGSQVPITFPSQGGDANFNIEIVDSAKNPPTIRKTGPAVQPDGTVTNFDKDTKQLTWTITITNNADSPVPDFLFWDSYSATQEYVPGSFKVGDDVKSDTGDGAFVTVDTVNRVLTADFTGATPGQVIVITYRTHILSTAFLNANGTPKTSGNINCTNTAQLFYPGGEIELTGKSAPGYNYPITWLSKTSGEIIDRATGEMEWTVTIDTNGLTMSNVRLYDRLSPGVVIKDNTATMSVNGGADTTLTDFKRTFTEAEGDQKLNGVATQAYNLLYTLPGSMNGIAVVKYHTVIADPDTYEAADYPPPDSIFNNKAFIQYDYTTGSGGPSKVDVVSPVVEKAASYDQNLLGKNGVIEPAYGTILWTLSVNNDQHDLGEVVISDALTRAGNKTTTDSKPTYRHYYVANDRSQPVFTESGGTPHPLTLTTSATPAQYTYKVVTDSDGQIYDLVFYLGDIGDKSGTVQFRSTVADGSVTANNVKGNIYYYKNKATLEAEKLNYFGYANAYVNYISTVIGKERSTNWNGDVVGAYDFENNNYAWIVNVNANKMGLTGICVTDVLAEGTALIDNTMKIQCSTDGTHFTPWYNFDTSPLTADIPKGSAGDTKPYYTYDDATREVKIYLPDTMDKADTKEAYNRIVFYVHVDPDALPAGTDIQNWALINNATLTTDQYPTGAVSNTVSAGNVLQMTAKTGKVYKNNGIFSVDYSVNVNRAHMDLPDGSTLNDLLPKGMTLAAESVKLYLATSTSPGIYDVIPGKNTGGVATKGAEVPVGSYSVAVTENDDGTSSMVVTLPEGTGTQMYVLEYSVLIDDPGLAPFKNNISVSGVPGSESSVTITSAELTGASGGGTLQSASFTNVILDKTDAETGEPLRGAVFGLYLGSRLVQQKTTDANGQIAFAKLIVGREYTITELSAPAGYETPVGVSKTFTAAEAVDADGDGQLDYVHFALTNKKQTTQTPETPETGGGDDSSPTPTPGPDSTPTPAPTPGPGILQVTKTCDFAQVTPGQQVTYTITATNIGGQPLTGVWLRDVAPSGMVYVSADGGGVYGYVNGSECANWFFATLAPGESRVVHLTTRVKECMENGDTLRNVVYAEVTGSTTRPFLNRSGNLVGAISNAVNLRVGSYPITGDELRASLWIGLFSFGGIALLLLLIAPVVRRKRSRRS